MTKVLKTNADLLTEQSGIKPSLTDEEVREYLALLIRETKKKNEA